MKLLVCILYGINRSSKDQHDCSRSAVQAVQNMLEVEQYFISESLERTWTVAIQRYSEFKYLAVPYLRCDLWGTVRILSETMLL